MTDIDIVADLAPRTGLPVVDSRPNARRWLESLAYGPEYDNTMNASAHKQNFGPVGAGTKTKQKLSAPDPRSNKNTNNNKLNMNTNHDHGLLEASELKIENIERLLLKHGFDAQIECDWITVTMPRWSLFINLVDDLPAVDLAGAFELRRGISTRQTLRFLNYCNNENRVVRFSLWEPPTHDAIDLTDLWGNVALPIRSGFSARQFVAALDLLCNGLEDAHAAAVEAGLVDPEESASHEKEACCHGL